MTIRSKALAAVWGILCLLTALIFLLRASFILRSADQADREGISHETSLAKKLIYRECDDLDRLAQDYAGWDETYNFIADRNTGYIESNFPSSTFTNNRLDLAILADAAGSAVFVESFDAATGLRGSLSEAEVNRVIQNGMLPQESGGRDLAAGVWMVDGAPALLSYKPILRSDLTGPPRGTLIFGRRLGDDLLSGLSEFTKTRVSLLPLDSPAVSGKLHVALRSGILPEGPAVELLDRRRAAGYDVLTDGAGSPSCILRCEGNRVDRTAYLITAAFVGATLLCGLMASGIAAKYLLDRLLFRRLSKLHALVAEVQRTRDYSLRADGQGGDEVGELASAFNSLLASLQLNLAERAQTHQLLTENERRLREIAARTGQLLYDYDPASDRVVWAGATGQIMGQSPEECAGVRWADWQRMIAPEERAAVSAALEQAGASGNAYVLEYRLTRADGSTIVVEDGGVAVPGNPPSTRRFMGSIADVTDKRAREAALVDSRNMLQTVLDNVHEAVIVHDWNGAIVDINAKTLKMYGLTREEALQYTIADLSAPGQILEDSQKVWAGVLAGNNLRFEWKAQRPKDKTQFDVEVDLTKIVSGGNLYVLCSVRDLTEIREAQRTAHENESRFKEMLERTSLLTLLLDANGHITFCNDAFVALTGWTREELLGLDYYAAIVAPEEREEGKHVYERVISDGVVLTNLKRTIVTKTGARRRLVWDTTHLRDIDGTRMGIAAIGRDVTDQLRLEEQYRQAQKMEAVGQLAGGVAHDFNNLLQVISGYIEMTLDEMPRTDAAYARLNEVKGAASRAATLVRQLLTFSRRDAAQMSRVDLNDVIANVVKLLRRVIGEHIALEVVKREGLPAVQGDIGQLDQVLMNLCVNARDAMPSGGTIRIATQVAAIGADYAQVHPWAHEGDYVLLEISDTGHGMSREVQEHIFEPFYTTKESGKGTGLGLATVYGIVKQHHGFIHVYSELDKGTIFRVYLPVAVGAVEADAPAATTPAPSPSGTETILIAEDEDQVRNLTSRLLQDAGYTVLLAHDGEEALRLFEANKEAISLCLLDVVMPKKSGRAVYDAIMALKPGMKVLFCSGYSFGMLQSEQLPETHVNIIQKPFSPGLLLRQVRETLDTATAV